MNLEEKIIKMMMVKYRNYLEANSEKLSEEAYIVCFPKDEWDSLLNRCAEAVELELVEGKCDYCGANVYKPEFSTDASFMCYNCYIVKRGYES